MAKEFQRWLIGHAVEIDGVPGLSVARLREDACRSALRRAKLGNNAWPSGWQPSALICGIAAIGVAPAGPSSLTQALCAT